MARVTHTVARLGDRWSLQRGERERCPDLIQYTGLMQAVPRSLDVNEKQQMCSPAFSLLMSEGSEVTGGRETYHSGSLLSPRDVRRCRVAGCCLMASTASFFFSFSFKPCCNALHVVSVRAAYLQWMQHAAAQILTGTMTYEHISAVLANSGCPSCSVLISKV